MNSFHVACRVLPISIFTNMVQEHTELTDRRMNPVYIVVCAITVFFSFFLHELSHWAAGELCGMPMGMTLNNAFGIGSQYIDKWKDIVIVAAGPAFTLIQATVFYFLL